MKESTGLEVRLVGRHAELNIDTGPPQALHANERGTGSRVTGRAAHARKRHAADTAHLATRQAARAPSRDQAAWQQGPECLARCHCRSGHTGRTATASLLAWCGARAHVRQPIRPGRHRTFKPGLAFALACASTPPRPRTSGSPALLPLWLASPMLPARRGPAPSLSAARPPDAGRS